MHRSVPRRIRPACSSSRLGAAAACSVLFFCVGQSAAQQPRTWRPAAGDAVAISAESLQPAAELALERGMRLEQGQKWAEAVGHYEQALRENPGDRRLRARHDLARIHHSLEKRYADQSFVDSVREIDARGAYDLYSELLAKIESHYVVEPRWGEITQRGATAVLVAASDSSFAARHGLRPSSEQVRALAEETRARVRTESIVTSRDAVAAAYDVARVAERRIGAPAAAWLLEFVAAASGGLDNYSSFLTPNQLREVYSQIEGNFVGLGVELKADEGALRIVRVIPGSPAERAGIVAGDLIVAVDGQRTAEVSTDRAAGLLSGVEGSVARVTVVSASAASDDLAHLVAKPVDGVIPAESAGQVRVLDVRREHVDVPSLEGVGIVDSRYGVAYVRVPVFQKSTSRDLEAALWDLHRQGMRTLVLDLRGNPGGLLTSAVELADKFVAQGNLVSTRGRSEGEDFDYRAHRAGTWRVPLVLLIDGDSASASEIFAAAMRDNGRATIVGDRSFGKGSVQGIFPLSQSGAGVRLTTAKFYSPHGNPISEVGVSPDIVVRDERPADAQAAAADAKGADAALVRALDVARRQVAMQASAAAH